MQRKVNRFRGLRRSIRSRSLLRPLAIPLILACLSACSLNPGRGVKSCAYRFQGFGFTGMDAKQTHWTVDVKVANPNSHEITLTRMRYALLYQADTLLSGWNPAAKTIPSGDSITVRTSLDLPNSIFQRLPPGIWSQTDARFDIVADAYVHTWVGDLVVPRAIRETVHIDMVEQAAKYRDMVMKRFFTWPGRHLEDGGINAPDASPPGPDDGSL